MEKDNQSSMSYVRPLILSIVMFIVILVVPAYIHFSARLEVSAITWLIRIEQDEPIRFFLTLDPIFFFNASMKYLFVIMVFRFYYNQTTLKRTLLFGVLIEIFIFVSLNFGNLLYTIFPQPGFYPSLPRKYPLPISIIVFLGLAKLYQPHKKPLNDDWFIPNKD